MIAFPAALVRTGAMSQTSLIARAGLAAACILAIMATPASARQGQAAPQQAQLPAGTNVPPVAAAPVPGEMELAQLIWSTMVMIEQANASGNYTVLRDNSATGFQINNDPAKLAQIFAGLRSTRIDLSTTLLTAPRYTAPPRQLRADVFQVQGYFPLRPRTVVFDLAFQWQNGRWRLFGVSVEPRVMLDQAEGAMPAPE